MSNKNASTGKFNAIDGSNYNASFKAKIVQTDSSKNNFIILIVNEIANTLLVYINPLKTTPNFNGTVTGVGTTGQAANTAVASDSEKHTDPFETSKTLNGTWTINETSFIDYSASSISDVPSDRSYTAYFTPAYTNYNSITTSGVKITSSIPAATEPLEMVSHTDTSITVKVNSSKINTALTVEYSHGGTTFTSSGTFSGLNPGSSCYFYYRYSTADGRSKGDKSSGTIFKTLAKEGISTTYSSPYVDYSNMTVSNLESGCSYRLTCASYGSKEYLKITGTTIPYLDEYLSYDISLIKLSQDTTVSVNSDPYVIKAKDQSSFDSSSVVLSTTWEKNDNKFYLPFTTVSSAATQYKLKGDTTWSLLASDTKVEFGKTYLFRTKGTSYLPPSTNYTLYAPKPIGINDNESNSGRAYAYPDYEHECLTDLATNSDYLMTYKNTGALSSKTLSFTTTDNTAIGLTGKINGTVYSLYGCLVTLTRNAATGSTTYLYSETQEIQIKENVSVPPISDISYGHCPNYHGKICIHTTGNYQYLDSDSNSYLSLTDSISFEPGSRVALRYGGTQNTACSNNLLLDLPGMYETPAVTINYASESIEGLEEDASYHLSVSDDEIDFTSTTDDNYSLTNLGSTYDKLKTTEGTLTRTSSVTNILASSPATISLLAKGTAPAVTLKQNKDGTFNIVGEDADLLEVSTGNTDNYSAITADQKFTFTSTKVKVRYKATADHYASEAITLTVPEIKAAPQISFNLDTLVLEGFDKYDMIYVYDVSYTTSYDGTLQLAESWMGETISIQTQCGYYASAATTLNIPSKIDLILLIIGEMTNSFDTDLTQSGLS